MIGIRLTLATLLAIILTPAVALAADGSVTGSDVAQGAGAAAGALALVGVLARLLAKSTPLHALLPARLQWLPDSLSAAIGVLLVGLPNATTTIGQIEVWGTAALMAALAAAPGHTAPSAKPPAAPPTSVLFVAPVLLLLAGGCAPSLARSAATPPRPTDGASPAQELDRCRDLSRAESALRYVAVGSAAASGAAGLTTIETDTPDADRALAITAASLAVGAVVAEAIRAEVANGWARECTP